MQRKSLGLLAAVAVLGALCLLSVWLGAKEIPITSVWRVLVHNDGSADAVIIHSVRIPRTLLGLLVGVGLGVAGTLMQALTRNPLADPGLLGVTAGAAFALVIAVAVLGVTSLYGYIWFAFAGALAASVLVYLLGSRGWAGASPVKLALAGVAVTALLYSFTSAIALSDPAALNRYRFWTAGSLAGQDTDALVGVLPFLLTGVALALAGAPALNSLALGDDVAASLGRRVGLVRLRGVLAVTLLTGAAVAVAGPIVFIGLVIPHIARMITGPDHRWVLPYAMVLAPSVVLAADIAGRILARPGEIQAGVIVAFVGAPFFIALVRRRRLAEL
ncbi:MAG TPA: iron chelate uptake ABC transporter family permease subunit [Actinophytocola sp.]|uniref:FecCD family ABC transporter permease n=1 Tax=Actinophytocola sp. TaxID=1872138 RepID=UPI002DDD775D|nr:iron chelate uptake ABC transporter family permease subunit [Actinophytocola sp.]HEV2782402.1 iron chelate uptake ABC transporter family permease subunit [Actinophytocola sp.]